MNNNTKFWIILIIISSLSIFVKNIDLKRGKTKKYIFKRVFLQKKIINKKVTKFNSSSFISLKDSLICLYKFEKGIASLSFYNKDFRINILKNIKITNPSFKQVSSFDLKNIYFINKFNLYSHSIENDKISKYSFKKLKIIKTYPLNIKLGKLLVLAEFEKNNLFHTGFYIINVFSNEIFKYRIIETNKESKKVENILIYSGEFSKNNKTIYYTCSKYSKIYIFNNFGEFLKEIQTKDNTPKPKLVSNEYGFYYKRDNTFNTNNGAFINNNNIYVFSSRTKEKGIIIDLYSLDSGSYEYSIRFTYKNLTSTDLNYVSFFNKKIFLYFENEQLEIKLE